MKEFSLNVSRIALGTVQFGQDYGIANNRGKILEKESYEILNYAKDVGVNCLDTACTYGDSESIIGEFLLKNKDSFNVVSKLSVDGDEDLEEIIGNSLKKLNMDSLYGYLLHRFEDFVEKEWLWNAFEGLKAKGLVSKIGFSLYNTKDLDFILSKNINFDLIQVPYSIFDRRFERYFNILKQKNVEIHVRSVFLQGLFFLDPNSLKGHLPKAKDHLNKIRDISQKNDISISALCLNYALLDEYIDKVVIGIDGLDHLRENIKNLNLFDKVCEIKEEIDKLSIEDEDILLPNKWS
ncbi:MAG: aldo/keto reductase [Candidatus Zapsychrus exili]|nr:aldo/keto reductase [Candidatus Zapsychrus exili]